MSNQIIHLHRFIAQRYSLEELETLCFTLGVGYEELPGWPTRSAKVREFLLQAGEQGKFETLLGQLEKDRPIPFSQSGLSNDPFLVQRLYDDLEDYRALSTPFYQKWRQQLQLDFRRALILLVFILVALIGGVTFLYLALRPDRPEKMIGEFNIAIAEFGEIDENGRAHASEEGADLSATIFTRVQKEMETLRFGPAVEVWHNAMNPGTRLAFLPGDNRKERAEAAADLAEKTRAHLIIYGNLQQLDQETQFLPEFYVADLPDAGELVGAHTLGSGIPIQGALNSLGVTLAFNERLTARTNALTLFAIGLAWEIAGEPDRALEKFLQAEAIGGWDDREGKEVLYLFIGREANLLWLEGEDRGDEVLAAMQKARDLNPEYGRAYIGLGNYHAELARREYDTMRALFAQNGEGVDEGAVMQAGSRFNQEANQAVRFYHEALDNLPLTAGELVETKVHLNLGSTHNRQAGYLLLLGEYDTAQDFLELALAENETAQAMAEDGDYRRRALAQLGIARAYDQQAYTQKVLQDQEGSEALYEKALEAYDGCIALAGEDPFDWLLKGYKEEQCEPGRRAAGDALARLKGEGS